MNRKPTRKIQVANLAVGGDAEITVQSMTTANPLDIEASLTELRRLQTAGCQIIRMSIPSSEAAQNIRVFKKNMNIPLVADIHFNYKLALMAIESGADKIRINPGNIGEPKRVKEILSEAKKAHIPIRIGVNSGSLEKDLLQEYGHPTAEAMVASAERHLRICQENDFQDVIVALKSSDVSLMIAANRLFSAKYDYPLHLGVTEAGPFVQGTVKSSVGIGTLLAEGIGDTLRVSLTDDPVQEVRIGFEILKAFGLSKKGIKIVSCPTCGRAQVNVIGIVKELEERTRDIDKDLTVAVMGCIVNGPGEAREADFGVACGKGEALFFKRGEVIGKIGEDRILDTLLKTIEDWDTP